MGSDQGGQCRCGIEAEELRRGIEKALEDHPLGDMGDFENMRESLCRLLDRVDCPSVEDAPSRTSELYRTRWADANRWLQENAPSYVLSCLNEWRAACDNLLKMADDLATEKPFTGCPACQNQVEECCGGDPAGDVCPRPGKRCTACPACGGEEAAPEQPKPVIDIMETLKAALAEEKP